jgi:peptidylprolyl isomerase
MGVTKEITKAAPAGAQKPSKGQTVTVHCTGIVKATGKVRTNVVMSKPRSNPHFRSSGPRRIPGKKSSASSSVKGRSSRVGKKEEKKFFFFFRKKKNVISNSVQRDEGVLTMSIGEHATLTCSPDYGYGEGGFPAWGIPGNAILDFQIELLSSK